METHWSCDLVIMTFSYLLCSSLSELKSGKQSILSFFRKRFNIWSSTLHQRQAGLGDVDKKMVFWKDYCTGWAMCAHRGSNHLGPGFFTNDKITWINNKLLTKTKNIQPISVFVGFILCNLNTQYFFQTRYDSLYTWQKHPYYLTFWKILIE